MTIIVGVTGQIASGKTALCSIARERGYSVFDADKCAKAYAGTAAIAGKISALFPGCDGDVNALRKAVFADPEAKKQLEALIHPHVIARAKDAIANTAAPLIFLDVPLLYQSGMDALCDRVLMIDAPDYMRRARLCARTGIDEPIAHEMMASQKDARCHRYKADILLDGGGTRKSLTYAAELSFNLLLSERAI